MFNIKLRVKNLIKKYDTTDPYIIAKELNIDLCLKDMPDRVNGMFRRILRRKYIVINSNLDEWQQKAVLCHELGHFLLHKGYTSYNMAGRTIFLCVHKEREANEFSTELMSYSSDIDKVYIIDFLEHGYKKRSC